MIETGLQDDDRVTAQATGAARPRVLVRYEPSPAGRAAVLCALDVARASGADDLRCDEPWQVTVAAVKVAP